MAKNIEDAVEEIVLPLLEGTELELVDVEYVKERDRFLRVFIDKEGGTGIEDCRALSEKIEKELDERDLISESYFLEVSSPGLDRVLRKPRDYVREKGKLVEVSLYKPINGEKLIVGELVERSEEALVLKEREPIECNLIAQVRLHIEF